MNIIKYTPDLLILRYRPVSLVIYGAVVIMVFVSLTVFALFQASFPAAIVLAAVTAVGLYAMRNQQLMVGVYFDKTHETVAVVTRQILSKTSRIYALSDVLGLDLEYVGLEERPVIMIKGQDEPRAVTQDYHPRKTMSHAVTAANAWLHAAR